MVAELTFLTVEYDNELPVVAFTSNTTCGDVPLAVQFTDDSTG